MKNIKRSIVFMLGLCASLFFFNAAKANTYPLPTSISIEKQATCSPDNLLKEPVVFAFCDKYALFYRASDAKFFAVQYEVKPQLSVSNMAITNVSDGNLTVQDLSTGVLHSFKFSPSGANEYEVFGVITFWGKDYQDTFLTTDSNGHSTFKTYVLPTGGDILNVKCGCNKEGSSGSCDHGGEGATECSVNDSGGVGTINWDNGCQVACKSGYYACCKK